MKIVNYIPNTPEETIALDELLLTKAEKGETGETLRFWISKEYFVVLGRAQKVREECFPDRCIRDSVKILRRVSGGGTVLQGPGCLNYSLILSYERGEEYRTIKGSYRGILAKMVEAFRRKGHNVEFFPISDLALDGRKISGNAQARKRSFFLHHGTILHDFDPDRISRYLKHPPKEPEYRNGRSHDEFVTNIPIEAGELKDLITDTFTLSATYWQPSPRDLEQLETLVSQKYSREKWNHAF